MGSYSVEISKIGAWPGARKVLLQSLVNPSCTGKIKDPEVVTKLALKQLMPEGSHPKFRLSTNVWRIDWNTKSKFSHLTLNLIDFINSCISKNN